MSSARAKPALPTSLWWIRRDLRLTDNPALQAALRHGAVVPVFILDPAASGSRYHARAQRRQAFLYASLRSLDAELRARGSRLVVRTGRPAEVLAQLAAETQANGLFAEEDHSPYARRRDAAVQGVLPLTLTGGLTVHHPANVQKAAGGPYTVFTPFSKAWHALRRPTPADLEPAPARLPAVSPALASEPLPAGEAPADFPAGEAEARRRLERFLAGPIHAYAEGRNQLAEAGTSSLSPYFRFGLLSARTAAVAALEAAGRAPQPANGAGTWLTELIWREFYIAVLYHFPHVLQTAFNPNLRAIAWRTAPEDFAAWQAGRTGYPVVDAAMRQLAQTGWMHNRARMIAASFLVKDLLIDWRLGEQWFMEQLVDGDPAANNGGWQWTAGTGTDAAPYFRIFNPVLQSQKFDPAGRYLRRFVPELAAVPDEYLHAPWKMPPLIQHQVGCVIGRDYPTPIVDRAAVKARTLAAYKAGA
ncbi:MAG: deoxyribodipyrimidine photo-lyase [Anaerolineales bacterium]|nr:deoxyribodipyrimidine photo-lyase [Anaerolineales bacterium]